MLFSGTRIKLSLHQIQNVAVFVEVLTQLQIRLPHRLAILLHILFKSLLCSSDNPASIAEIVSVSSSKIRSI